MEGLNSKKAWLFLAPALVLMAVFTFYPLIQTLIFSFLEGYNGLDAAGGETFSFGFENYTRLFTNQVLRERFLVALINTSIIVFVTVPLSVIISLLIAVALNSIKPLQKFFQTLYFLPYVTNSLAIGAVFAVMFQNSGVGTSEVAGIINTILSWFGIPEIEWFGAYRPDGNFFVRNFGGDYIKNMFVLFVYSIWNALPFKILILLGALQNVNKQYYDAAKIDCAPKRRVLLKITVPLLSPMISYLLITGFIGAFKEYTSVVGIFGETMGPAGNSGSLNTIVALVYDYIQTAAYGRASAVAMILFIIILLFTLVQFRVNKKRVHY